MIFYTNLPVGYSFSENIDPEKNKKESQLINMLTVLIALAMLLPTMFLAFPALSKDWLMIALPIVVCVLANVCFLFIRELTQGLFFYIFTGKAPVISFQSDCFYVGCQAYVDKTIYILVTILPTILWGLILLIPNFLLKDLWFWAFFIVQVFNIAGAVGVVFTAVKLAKQTKNVLVQDDGTKINVFKKV